MAGRKKHNKKTTGKLVRRTTSYPVADAAPLLADLRALIRQARAGVARAVNSALVVLYWPIGHRIHTEILQQKRAAYGEQVVPALAGELTAEFGDGFSRPNLFRMVRFAEVFPDREIVSALSRQLGWSHFVEIIPLDDPLKREFYAELCRVERWSVRTLREKIQGMMFERTALSRKPEELVTRDLAVLRDEDPRGTELATARRIELGDLSGLTTDEWLRRWNTLRERNPDLARSFVREAGAARQ